MRACNVKSAMGQRAAKGVATLVAAGSLLLIGGCAIQAPSFMTSSAKPPRATTPPPRQDARAPYRPAPSWRSGLTQTRRSWPWSHTKRGSRSITVGPSDTLYGLSSRFNVSISELMAANRLSSPQVRPGQQLIVPDTREARLFERSRQPLPAPQPARRVVLAPKPAAPAARRYTPRPQPARTRRAGQTARYQVRRGDTLYGIARRFQVPVGRIANANRIRNTDHLEVGRVLSIPLR